MARGVGRASARPSRDNERVTTADLPHPIDLLPELPSVEDLLASMQVVRLPMNVRFRGIEQREVALLEGPVGWGELGPFLEYGPAEASRWLAAAIEAAHVGWPAAQRPTVPVNATVPAVPASQVGEVLARYDGFGAVKVKVAEAGQTLADDVARLAAVREQVGPGTPVRVDANGAWDVDGARTALRSLAAHGLEYVEQPCRSVEELRDLRRALARAGVAVPIAADESIRRADDPLRVAHLEAADLVVVKVAPLGGVRMALAVIEACGLPAVVSSAIDTSVGLSAGVALAGALPQLPYACGLGTGALLAADVTTAPLTPVGGSVEVRPVEVDRGALAAYAVDGSRRAWWEERVRAAYAVLATGR